MYTLCPGEVGIRGNQQRRSGYVGEAGVAAIIEAELLLNGLKTWPVTQNSYTVSLSSVIEQQVLRYSQGRADAAAPVALANSEVRLDRSCGAGAGAGLGAGDARTAEANTNEASTDETRDDDPMATGMTG